MQEVLVIKSDFDRFDIWEEAFAGSGIALRQWDDPGDLNEIKYALVWQPEPHRLAAMPNLQVVFSIGAGIDHLQPPNCVPLGLPVVRMVEQALTAGMREYVLFHVLRFHRFMDVYARNQQARAWVEIMQRGAATTRVGILGLGELGGQAAAALAPLGFAVQGWSRSQKTLAGVKSFYGDNQFNAFLASTDILVCLLPLTPATADIINAKTLDLLPKGAFFINAGRGGHVDEVALLEALDSGQLGGAALDVFKTEPLAADSPFWSHPKVMVTPHIASMTTPASSAQHVIENIQRFRSNKPMTHLADLQRGY